MFLAQLTIKGSGGDKKCHFRLPVTIVVSKCYQRERTVILEWSYWGRIVIPLMGADLALSEL